MSKEGNSIRREKSMMTVFAVVVLSALTIMGIYMKNRRSEVKLDDGYTIDFAALKERASQKMDEIAANPDLAESPLVDARAMEEREDMDGELDYMPMEAGSEDVQIKGLTKSSDITDKKLSKAEDTLPNMIKNRSEMSSVVSSAPAIEGQILAEEQLMSEEQLVSEEPLVSEEQMALETDFGGLTMHYAPENGLTYPADGDILMHYSMDKSIYFKTLDQYQYNPAVIFKVDEGKQVYACAAGKVIDIHEDAKLGLTLTLDLGDGYQATYGQLHNLAVCANMYVDEGTALGFVNAPTRYYSLEGSNLYFKLTKDGTPVNPEELFR